MSVLACERRNCQNIMCRTIIKNHYVCDDCLSEFKNKFAQNFYTEQELSRALEEFLGVEHIEEISSGINAEEFIRLNAEFYDYDKGWIRLIDGETANYSNT